MTARTDLTDLVLSMTRQLGTITDNLLDDTITGADIARARLICHAAPVLLRGVAHLYIESGATVDEFLAYMHAELTDPQEG